MEICVTYGTGEGPTDLAAFDAALHDAGISNYNLITLSSIIPAGSRVKIRKFKQNEKEYGNKLFVVLSKKIETTVGKEAWAGLGWTQDNLGRGVFVEHWGDNKMDVEKLIASSLEHMISRRRGKYGKIRRKIVGIKCKGKPVCAVVVAIFKNEGWGD